jgi:hypothetical protein
MTEFTSKLTKEDWIGFNRIYGKYTFKKFFLGFNDYTVFNYFKTGIFAD